MVPPVKASRVRFHHEAKGGSLGSGRGKNEGCAIPRYEFMCEKCNKPFELIMTFAEREKG